MSGAELYFGGSFDPIHLGHLFAASEAAAETGAGSVLFVPTGQNPLKQQHDGAPAADRLEMVRAAVAGDDRFRVSDIELHSREPSYTIDTIRRLIDRGELVERPGMIIGDDLIPELPRWREVEQLLTLVRLVLVTRHGVEPSQLPAAAGADYVVVPNPAMPISSTAVRDRLRHRRSVRYLVPDSVYDFIRRTGIYD